MKNDHLTHLLSGLKLGKAIGTPKSIYGSRGGSLMWKVNTKSQSYAIKQLSPDIDLNNEKVVTKYELSEQIAHEFMQRGIPAVTAIKKSGKHLIIIENTGYLIYPWIDGYTLSRNEISELHAIIISTIVASLHNINLHLTDSQPSRFDIHSNETIVKAINTFSTLQHPISRLLKESQEIIFLANTRYQASIPTLEEKTVITHGDLDQLNVIWDERSLPTLIDWESTRKMNPTRDIVRTSLAWSGMGSDHFSLPLFENILKTYVQFSGVLNKNHIDPALNSTFGSMINWLLYNINTATNCNDEEINDAAINEIEMTILVLNRITKLFSQLHKTMYKFTG